MGAYGGCLIKFIQQGKAAILVLTNNFGRAPTIIYTKQRLQKIVTHDDNQKLPYCPYRRRKGICKQIPGQNFFWLIGYFNGQLENAEVLDSP